MDIVEIFKVLGDYNRIRILNLLMKEELCVCEIETILNITQSNASRHLNKLKSCNIINYDKKSQWVYYYINSEFISENKLLYEFLQNKVKQYNQCIEDDKKLERYKNSKFTCKEIREDKQQVLKCIKGCNRDQMTNRR